ncbi:sterol desaturase family protein [Flavobacterium sp. H122]|uniref:sterol desaturase family protein n=1 Tax=Flavobacterium sp. H122 TaxID=2529860 RepID=UPI0010AA3F51|nr:sterol desaturase family protein [Flavobacterium sp. H122]
MYTFDFIGTVLLFSAFLIEFTLILWFSPKINVIKDMAANCFLGLGVIGVGIFEKTVAFSFFSFTYNFSFFKPEQSLGLWIAAFFCCDFIHYVYHWLGHKTKLFWTSHVTHHSSKEFNLSIGFRINCLQLFYRFLFWLPLCLLGFTPEMILFFESLTAIQQFFVHTERIGKLGIIDWIINTPSNHRVHHATNPEYIDKNLGGFLMIFDHLFGTYAREKAKPIYGITHEINTYNPLKILTHEYKTVFMKTLQIKGFMEKIHFLLSPPV